MSLPHHCSQEHHLQQAEKGSRSQGGVTAVLTGVWFWAGSVPGSHTGPLTEFQLQGVWCPLWASKVTALRHTHKQTHVWTSWRIRRNIFSSNNTVSTNLAKVINEFMNHFLGPPWIWDREGRTVRCKNCKISAKVMQSTFISPHCNPWRPAYISAM